MRTFLAIELSAEVRHFVGVRQETIRAWLAREHLARSLRWSRTENLHLTLRFLGDTRDDEVDGLTSRLATVVDGRKSFRLSVERLGAFPKVDRPRVIWLGIGGEVRALRRLQEDVEMAVQASGFAAESKSYSPHLTLGRLRKGVRTSPQRRIGALLAEQIANETNVDAATSPSLNVDGFALFKSELRPGGPVYTRLARYSFSARTADPST